MQRFLDKKYLRYIDKLFDEARIANNKVYKKDLYKKIETPALNIVPITNESELAEFIAQFSVLQRIDIVIHRKNAEPTASAMLKSVEAFNDSVDGQQTKISTVDSRGLDKDKVTKVLSEITDGANETIKLTGKDLDGAGLAGENDNFSVRAIVDNLPFANLLRAKAMYYKFLEYIEKNILKRPELSKENIDKVEAAIGELNE